MDHSGMDVHKKESQICILTEEGELIEHRKDKSPFSVLPLRLTGAPTVTSSPNASALTSR